MQNAFRGFIRILIFKAGFAAAMLLSTSLHAQSSEQKATAYSVGFSRQTSARYDGSILQAGIETSASENLRLNFGALTLKREYSADARIADSSFAAGAAYNFGAGTYFESRIEHSPDAEILPRSTFAIAPHKVIGATDFGLGFDYRTYPNVTAGTLHPSVRHEFGSRTAVTIGSFIARSDSTLTSYHGDVSVVTFEGQTARASVASGKTLEDAGVSAGFSSVYAGYLVTCGRFNIGVDASRYWSDLRTETSVGLRLEYK